jgi:hypothetical protein
MFELAGNGPEVTEVVSGVRVIEFDVDAGGAEWYGYVFVHGYVLPLGQRFGVADRAWKEFDAVFEFIGGGEHPLWAELAGEEVVEEVCDLLGAVWVGWVSECFNELVAEEDGGFFEWLVGLLGGDVGVEDVDVAGLKLVGEVQHGVDGVIVGSEDSEGFVEEAQG